MFIVLILLVFVLPYSQICIYASMHARESQTLLYFFPKVAVIQYEIVPKLLINLTASPLVIFLL